MSAGLGTLRSPSLPAVFPGMTRPAASVAPGLVVGLTAGGGVSGTTGAVADSLVADGAGRAWLSGSDCPQPASKVSAVRPARTGTSRTSTARWPWDTSTSVGGEVLVVGVGPASSPGPALRSHAGGDRPGRDDHALPHPSTVEVGLRTGRVDAAGCHVGVLHGIDVDRVAVGVLG